MSEETVAAGTVAGENPSVEEDFAALFEKESRMPERLDHSWVAMDFQTPFSLEFLPPDTQNFPALTIAYEAARLGGAAPAWLSAANEVAVAAFLNDRISWRQIVETVAETLALYEPVTLTSLTELLAADKRAREVATANLPR